MIRIMVFIVIVSIYAIYYTIRHFDERRRAMRRHRNYRRKRLVIKDTGELKLSPLPSVNNRRATVRQL